MTETAEKSAESIAATEANLKSQGKPTHDSIQQDYFAFDYSEKVMLPDGISWIEHKKMNEGAKRKYLNNTNRKVDVSRVTGNASISASPGDERKALLVETICDWNMMSQGQNVPFNKANLERFLDNADPKVVDEIEKAIRLANPWLLAELSIEDIDREIEALQEMRAKKVEEEEGKDGSKN